MSTTKQQKYEVSTEKEILKRIPKLTAKALYDMRLDMGMEYLRDRYSEGVAKQLWKTKMFWGWWHRMWEINDKRIITALKESGLEWGEVWFYEDMQRTNCEKWDTLRIVHDQSKQSKTSKI